MIVDISTMTIAVISLVLSVYVITRDRKNKKLDNLTACRQRVIEAFENNEILTVDQMIEYFEMNPHSPEAQKHKALSQEVTARVDREIEFACYLVITKQVDFASFFDLFGKWLAMRQIDWDDRSIHKKANNPFTWKVIQLYEKKRMLPL
jgi:hypothetical protein